MTLLNSLLTGARKQRVQKAARETKTTTGRKVYWRSDFNLLIYVKRSIKTRSTETAMLNTLFSSQ